MNQELKRAAEQVLTHSGQSPEYQRRMMKLLENVTTSNYTDDDVRQVIDLAVTSEEE